MKKHPISLGIAGVALATGSLVAAPGLASASTPPSPKFVQAQQNLEQQLTYRTSQLARLSADVTASKTLTSAHAQLLSSRLTTESAAIAALTTKVPTDTTWAELDADRKSMLADNRVYAVMTPQTFETIEADSLAAQIATYQAEEPALLSSVNSLNGQPGYKTAVAHYDNFTTVVGRASTETADVATTVLAQIPQDFPGDTHVFVSANKALLHAGLALAYASYDASVIGLATGGYTGS